MWFNLICRICLSSRWLTVPCIDIVEAERASHSYRMLGSNLNTQTEFECPKHAASCAEKRTKRRLRVDIYPLSTVQVCS
jgi:hypothetical protein